MGLCPDAKRALVQASALYGAEMWWDDRQGAGVKTGATNFRSWLGRAVTGNFGTTNLGEELESILRYMPLHIATDFSRWLYGRPL